MHVSTNHCPSTQVLQHDFKALTNNAKKIDWISLRFMFIILVFINHLLYRNAVGVHPCVSALTFL